MDILLACFKAEKKLIVATMQSMVALGIAQDLHDF